MQGRAVNRNPTNADPSGIWWGGATGRYYACQGNTLTGRDVVAAMARAYEETKGSLADRLMAALVAGDRAGGDHRGRLAAGIRVAKKGVPGYWLELDVDKHPDAVAELARQYAELKHEAKGPSSGGKCGREHDSLHFGRSHDEKVPDYRGGRSLSSGVCCAAGLSGGRVEALAGRPPGYVERQAGGWA